MANEPSTSNQVNATTVGPVIQAGVVHQVVMLGNDAVPVPRQLPGAVGDFVGRADEVTSLDSLLHTAPGSAVQVVQGTAGVGKTSLVVWWAHRVQESFPDGTLFANLKGFEREQPLHPSSVITSFLQALGVAEVHIPADLDSQASIYRSIIAGRRVLVVLDNAGSAEQVRPLLPASEGCVAVVTSRKALTGLVVTHGARSLSLGMLSRAEARTLLRGVIGGAKAEREAAAVDRLADLCAGLPLAVRIAAGRAAGRATSTISDLVEEIGDDRFRLDGLRDDDDDRSTVRTMFDWSYAKLPGEVASLFRRLGLHPNPEFSLPAAAAFANVEPMVALRQLETLINVNLVDPVTHRRYRLHDLLRLYSVHRVEEDEPLDQRAAATGAGLSWYARTALAADRLVFPAHPHLSVCLAEPVAGLSLTDRDQAWTWLNTELHTLMAALRQAIGNGMSDVAIALAGSMRFLAFRSRSLWSLRLEADSLGLHAARGDADTEVIFRRRRADTHQMLGRWAESDADLRACVPHAEERGDRLLLGIVLCGLGRNRKLQHQFEAARELYTKALPLVRGSGYVEAVAESNLSQISAALGWHDDALAHAERELELRRGENDPVGESYALHNVAVAHQGLGNDRAAVEFGDEAIAYYRTAAATERYLADALQTVALSYERLGQHAAAAPYLTEAAAVLDELGDPQALAVRSKVRRDGSSGPARTGHTRGSAGSARPA
ncbi:tetratricopeptide repeat protein [Actinosynnema sp. NPDC023658]|uniref:ATP-binding protein n=1 Tax=Actinosynnema sp. NPDC023658 TaxID=3155465 RepID=UPI0033CE3EEB